MPGIRVNVPLEQNEATALLAMAKADCRPPRDQLRHLLREAAHKRGLLPAEAPADQPTKEAHDATQRPS